MDTEFVPDRSLMRFASRLPLAVALALVAVVLAAAPAGAEGPSETVESVDTVLVRPVEGLRVTADADLDALPGVEVDEQLDEVGLLRLEVTPQGRAALEASGLVGEIMADHRLEVFLADSTAAIGADAVFTDGYDGDGAVIAVIDSGVDTTHSSFAGRVVAEACFLASVGGLCPTGGTSSSWCAVKKPPWRTV